MSKEVGTKYLPFVLLGLLVLVGLITIFTQADNYGITWDEPLQDRYGLAVLKWYESLGRDTHFLTAFPANDFMPEHGGFFDAMVAAVQEHFSPAEHWRVRHIFTALTGLLGIVAIALCGYELGGYWLAFLAALALWFYPRYYGAMYNNPKDIPAAVATLFVLWAVLILVRQWEEKKLFIRNSILVGFCIGLATAIRVNTVIWYLLLVFIAVSGWFLPGQNPWRAQEIPSDTVKQALAAGIIGITSLLTMMVFWPYIFLNPFANLFNSIAVISHYPWTGVVFYDGSMIPGTRLPLTYAPKWLIIGSPPALIIFAFVGILIAGCLSLRKKVIEPKIAVVFLAFFVPLGAIMLLHSTLYNSLRQFLFLVPAMILIAAYGFIQLFTGLVRRKQAGLKALAVGLVVVTLISYALVAREMITLSPFEYTYFSPFVGGLPGASHFYETDYWAMCNQQAAQWLNQHYQGYTMIPHPIVADFPHMGQLAPYLSSALQSESYQVNEKPADFYVATIYDNADRWFPSYRIIHVVAVEGAPFCVIKINPAIESH